MFLIDVNVLVYAHRADAPSHSQYRAWLSEVVQSDAAYGMSDLVLSGFLRIVTHPRVFRDPTPLDTALAFAGDTRSTERGVPPAPTVPARGSGLPEIVPRKPMKEGAPSQQSR